ncbi:GNAT family protein [Pandoraea sp. XJJ-1]|uniref:GNAT family N-acetyltransferase n=1 Tax=Pandoraea sp. XJJ-1 TaxID=3002643 RepID=UPI00227F3A3B|nr:GNAT family protein [Pandoraea sp. XJJ-1]WAL81314.1 GNAT family protein [Pandoraea sp. XJJ-1]
MKRIVWDQPERVMQFVAERTGEAAYRDYTAIGLERDGELVAGVVYQMHTGPAVLTHIASDGTRAWLTPAYLGAIFRYPFLQLGCNRITAIVRADNADSLRFVEHLGFEREGVMRQAERDGTDLIIFGMLKGECRFIEGRHHAALLRAA